MTVKNINKILNKSEEKNKKLKVNTNTNFKIIKRCKDTRARVSILKLNKGEVNLPCFMPVATYGALKSADPSEEEIILGNTFHLRDLGKCISKFMGYNKPMLTDSGGFQMITIENEVKEEGVTFKLQNDFQKHNSKKDENFFKHFVDFDNSKIDNKENKENSVTEIFLSPEKSIFIQNDLNSDIMMQLDDVVPPDSERVEEACKRSVRWLDRCIAEQKRLNNKNFLFPIIQGGCSKQLREYSATEIVKRIKQNNLKGVAIGGLCGGENKNDFFETIFETTKIIDKENQSDKIPKYTMGIGYPTDILLSIALGSDMSDCVYPTRTARFGNKFIDKSWSCDCDMCGYDEDYIKTLKGTTNYLILMTHHNLYFLRNFTRRIREAILEDRFVDFIKKYFNKNFDNEKEKHKLEWMKKVFLLLDIK